MNDNKSYFLRRGNTFSITDSKSLDIRDELPAGIYRAQYDPDRGFFLQEVGFSDAPHRLYGSTSKLAERVCAAFNERKGTTGVLLVGEKGSGKTMTARVISQRLLSHGIPTVIISTGFAGDAFQHFLNSITQPCAFIFDEFEKVFTDKDARTGMLSFFDGLTQSKKLCIVTANEQNSISEFMINRPGRLLYRVTFDCVDPETIRDYCKDNLKNTEQVPAIEQLAEMVGTFTFDMLVNLVEEMNRFDEPAFKAIRYLNIRPGYTKSVKYEVQINPIANPTELVILNNISGFNPQHFGKNTNMNVEFYTYPRNAAPPEGHDNISKYNIGHVENHRWYYVYLEVEDIVQNNPGSRGTKFVKDGFEFVVFAKKHENTDPFFHL